MALGSFSRLLSSVLPARCPITGDIVEVPGLVSASVWSRVNWVEQPYCMCCGIRFDVPVGPGEHCPACLTDPPAFDHARSVMTYDDISRDMILAFKHGDQTHLVATFTPWIARIADEFRRDTDVIMPVPLHRYRLLARRYNQAGLLAQGLARVWQDVPHDPFTLIRVKSTPSQGHMTRVQREENVAGAFTVRDPSRVKGKRILLVDDVYTTGATVEGCARVLKRAGAASVNVVTLARVMRDHIIDEKRTRPPNQTASTRGAAAESATVE